MSQIMLYFLHNTSVLSFYIDVDLTLSIGQIVIMFQTKFRKLYARTHTPTLMWWNKLMSGEIRRLFARVSISIDSLLQPGGNGECVAMILLFGSVPSWYRWPCQDPGLYFTPIVCKRRRETWQRSPHRITSRNIHSVCHADGLLIFDQCFTLGRGLQTIPPTGKFIRRSTKQYLVQIISIMSRQTSNTYQIYIPNHFAEIRSKSSCIKTVLTPGISNDVMRRVIPTQVPCKNFSANEILFVGVGRMDTLTRCNSNHIQCDDGTCISHNSLCNFNNHCEVGKIDVNTPHTCITSCMLHNCSCPPNYFQCSSGGCIQMAFICDGNIDCTDASDEFCGIETKEHKSEHNDMESLVEDRYFCLGHHCLAGECIDLKYVDDLLPDCLGGQADDEALFLRLRYDGERFDCREPTHFPCVGGLPVCFPINKFCVFEQDEDGYPMWCRDGSHLGQCAEINCTNSYKCPDSYCIPFHKVCDGHSNCIHGEDEERCDEYVCKGLLRCSGSKICVHPEQICNKVRDCINGDDEMFCDMKSCPNGCQCLSYSITCSSVQSNVLPALPSERFKHMSVINSSLPFPNFDNICNQRELLFLNLSENQIQHICGPLMHDCEVFKKITALDISHNQIVILRSHCFKLLSSLKVFILAHNPLQTLERYAISHPLLSYISIHSTAIKYLRGYSLVGMRKLYSFDITKIHLHYIDRYADTILAHISDFRLDDIRLCCIFIHNKYCIHKIKPVKSACFTLLPYWLTAYTLIPTGVLLGFFNVYAFGANQRFARGLHYVKFVSFLNIIDAILALYLPIIGAVDLYYNSHFPLMATRWKKSILCHLVHSVSATMTMLSVFFCGFLIYLTSEVVIKIDFNLFDAWRTIRIFTSVVIVTVMSFNLLVSMLDYFLNDSVSASRCMCNVMGNSPMSSWTNMVSMTVLCILMLFVMVIIMTSTLKLILFTRKIVKEFEHISGIKSKVSQSGSDLMSYITILVIAKTMILTPYPLVQILDLIFVNFPEIAHFHVMVTFITLECLINPFLFVFRPLMVQKRKHNLN